MRQRMRREKSSAKGNKSSKSSREFLSRKGRRRNWKISVHKKREKRVFLEENSPLLLSVRLCEKGKKKNVCEKIFRSEHSRAESRDFPYCERRKISAEFVEKSEIRSKRVSDWRRENFPPKKKRRSFAQIFSSRRDNASSAHFGSRQFDMKVHASSSRSLANSHTDNTPLTLLWIKKLKLILLLLFSIHHYYRFSCFHWFSQLFTRNSCSSWAWMRHKCLNAPHSAFWMN